MFHSEEEKKLKNTSFIWISNKDYSCELCTIYSSNKHHDIAVNITRHLSLEGNHTVNQTQFYSTATRRKKKKVPENPEMSLFAATDRNKLNPRTWNVATHGSPSFSDMVVRTRRHVRWSVETKTFILCFLAQIKGMGE